MISYMFEATTKGLSCTSINHARLVYSIFWNYSVDEILEF